MKDNGQNVLSPAQRANLAELEVAVKDGLVQAGKALETRPVLAVAIGVGIGFLLARLLGD